MLGRDTCRVAKILIVRGKRRPVETFASAASPQALRSVGAPTPHANHPRCPNRAMLSLIRAWYVEGRARTGAGAHCWSRSPPREASRGPATLPSSVDVLPENGIFFPGARVCWEGPCLPSRAGHFYRHPVSRTSRADHCMVRHRQSGRYSDLRRPDRRAGSSFVCRAGPRGGGGWGNRRIRAAACAPLRTMPRQRRFLHFTSGGPSNLCQLPRISAQAGGKLTPDRIWEENIVTEGGPGRKGKIQGKMCRDAGGGVPRW